MHTPAASRQLAILKTLCNLPTAPYHEGHVIDWIIAWAARHHGALGVRRDRAGNVYLEYRRGPARRRPLVIEAHMDHPGFVITGRRRDGTIAAEFRGGVKPSHFRNARAKFWLPGDAAAPPLPGGTPREALDLPRAPAGRWIGATVLDVRAIRGRRPLHVTLALRVRDAGTIRSLVPGTLGMWDLPDARLLGRYLAARVCDDLAGVAAMVCMMEELIARRIRGHIIGLCSRAEEVGFAGVLAVCKNRWLPERCPVIGLETSKALAHAPQGGGPVIRVGDRMGLFSAGLTHFIAQCAGHIGDLEPAFRYQRRLMDGGTCNSTAFAAWGYDSAALCLALGNYHNQRIKGEVGHDIPGLARAGGGITSEVIDIDDFVAMVRLLVRIATDIGQYRPGMAAIRQRFARMHREEQVAMLYGRR